MAATRQDRLDRLAHARGVDWFPSWARCNVDYFTVAMPADTARRELRLVQGLGFDHVRIWLNAWGHATDPAAYVGNLTLLLDAAHELGLGVVVELFDSCGIEPSRGPGSLVRIEDIPALGAETPSMAAVDSIGAGRGRDLFLAPALVEVPWRGDASVAVWEGFVPNPGYDWLAPQHWPRWDAYATDVIRAVQDHPALLLLEVMNEPFITHLGDEVDRQPIIDFYRHVIELARALDPDLPLAIGAAQPFIADHDANAPDLDVVSFHSLAGPDALHGAIQEATRVAAGRPVYCSEWGYFPGGTDEQQLRELQQLLPILDEARIGWAVTHLIAGYGPFANTALLYPSGVMRPGAVWLREQLQVGAEPQGATA
jgi:hypothetical protein